MRMAGSLLLLVSTLALPCSAQKFIHQCKEDVATRNPDAAIRGCTQTIESESPSQEQLADAFDYRGLAYEVKGEYDRAIEDLTKAVQYQPDFPEAHFELGYALEGTGDLRGAIREYREVIRLDPDYARAHGNLGAALYAKGELDKAIAEFDEAIRLNPDLAEAYTDLGLALKAKGELEAAIAEYKEAIRHDPNFALAYANLGNALMEKGDLDGAIAEERAAIRLQPNLAGAHTNLGNALYAKGNLGGAVAEFREAIHLRPASALPHNNLGNALAGRGDRAAGRERDRPPHLRHHPVAVAGAAREHVRITSLIARHAACLVHVRDRSRRRRTRPVRDAGTPAARGITGGISNGVWNLCTDPGSRVPPGIAAAATGTWNS